MRRRVMQLLGRKKAGSFFLCVMMVLGVFTGIDLVLKITFNATGAIIYVDGANSGFEDGSPTYPYNTIQEGVDSASPGDIVQVIRYSQSYIEDVTIDKTIDLIGNNSPEIEGIISVQASNCLITGFIVSSGGIHVPLGYGYCTIESNTVRWGGGIYCDDDGNIIRKNIISSTTGIYTKSDSIIEDNIISGGDYYGIEIAGQNVIIDNNTISNTGWYGIYTWGFSNSQDIIISNNTIKDSYVYIEDGFNIQIFDNTFKKSGLEIWDSECINVTGNDFSDFSGGAVTISMDSRHIKLTDCQILNSLYGIFIYDVSDIITISNCTINNSDIGIDLGNCFNSINVEIINSVISNSISSDIHIYSYDEWTPSYLTAINTSFNKSKVDIEGPSSILEVRWFMDINVTNNMGNPVSSANVKVRDNANGTYEHDYITGPDGYVRSIEVIEYIQNSSSTMYYSPHYITAWKGVNVGYANPWMDWSKTVNVTLYEGTLLDLNQCWNLISSPVIPSETEIGTVLGSLEDLYDSVQIYDSSDSADPWKHNHVSKPSIMNDLNQLDHLEGIFVHIIDPNGATLVLNGSSPSSQQNISLFKGWNMVGYPSLSDKDRAAALNNLIFATHVDAIWTYNALSQTWEEVGSSDYFELGRGYWIHAKTDCIWQVPL